MQVTLRPGAPCTHSGSRRVAWALAITLLASMAGRAAAVEGTGPIEVGTEPIFSHSSPVGDISYTPGRGLQLGDTGLNLGGYTDLVVTRNE